LTKFIHRILPCYFTDTITSKQRRRTKLSKEFVRRWLIENGFQGLEGQQIPNMTDEYIETVSERYIELYENILGEKL
jgi:phosphoribosylaminoimidazole-succinocarboxamide synthase